MFNYKQYKKKHTNDFKFKKIKPSLFIKNCCFPLKKKIIYFASFRNF